MRGVVNDKSEKAIAAQRATRMKTLEGQRLAVGYECAKHRNMAGIRLALANVRRPRVQMSSGVEGGYTKNPPGAGDREGREPAIDCAVGTGTPHKHRKGSSDDGDDE